VPEQPIPHQRHYAGGPATAIVSDLDESDGQRPGWIEPVSMVGSLPGRRAPRPSPGARPLPSRTVERPSDPELVPFGVLTPPSQRNDWRGWWDGPRTGRPTPAPAPPPRAAIEEHRPTVDVPEPRTQAGRPTLRRRVPQSHLAPELRHEHEDMPPPQVHAGTADALSRYQASRQAARADAERSDGRP
jgi:hypothetical protein